MKIRKLVITGFRGIRKALTLDFTRAGSSLVIFGANAQGKSSIGDAFEWFFSGSIEELRKEGCTRQDYRHRLLTERDDTTVSIEFTNAGSSSAFVLHSDLHQRHSNISPDFEAYRLKSERELLILRHKDLKRFVDETKGNKRREFAQLIGMESWEIIRNDLIAAENQLSGEYATILTRIDERKQEVIPVNWPWLLLS